MTVWSLIISETIKGRVARLCVIYYYKYTQNLSVMLGTCHHSHTGRSIATQAQETADIKQCFFVHTNERSVLLLFAPSRVVTSASESIIPGVILSVSALSTPPAKSRPRYCLLMFYK